VARRRAADGAAAIYATHDAAEALAIADRVAVLHSGALAQAGPPAAVYAEPADLTVARLTGPVSVLTGIPDTIEPVPVSAGPGADPGTVLVRPDWARLGGDLPGILDEVRFRGPHTDYRLATPAGSLLIREPGPPRAGPGPLGWSLLRARLIPAS
jgi:ABC-type Fe3+/spermidine/putrescine transport system ATPase subunit